MATPGDSLLVRFAPPAGGVLTVPAPGDLRYTTEIPGGYRSLSCSLQFPAGTATPAALQVLAQVSVVDRRTGAVVWHGELTDPGLTVGRDGQTYAITAEGSQLRADGWRQVYGLVDRAKESWQAVGDFSGSAASFSGDFSPNGDYNFDGSDDLLDFGDDLGIDFGGGDLLTFDPVDFGGDLGDFNNIDFTGVDYPEPAGYDGYLGFLQDPFSDVPGTQLPIPLGDTFGTDGSFWQDWVPGVTTFGASAVGTGTTGTLRFTPAIGSRNGSIRRRRTADRGLMQAPRFYAPDSLYWNPAVDWSDPDHKPMYWVQNIFFQFRLMASGARAMIWLWADPDLASSGYYFEATETAFSLYRVEGGAASLLATAPYTAVVGTLYSVYVIPATGVGNGPGDYVGYDPAKGYIDGLCLAGQYGSMVATVWHSSDLTNSAGITYIPDSDPSFTLAMGPVTWVNRPTNGVQHYMLQDDRYWGLAMEGDGSTSPQDVEFSSIKLNNVIE